MTPLASLVFPPDPMPVVPIAYDSRGYPVHRIFCVGRNYAEHAKEMGFDVDAKRLGISPSPPMRSSYQDRPSRIPRRPRITIMKWSWSSR
jgi:2-keto-4-pentenoate hydratase/2-oxohepta-3-ene-1,7-dioic acid hydratase in catechol pathway